MLLPHTPATGFEIGARGIEGVRTPRGTIATRAVVDAAGAWARVVAAGLGAALPALPVVPTRHQLLITEPIAGVGPEFPIPRVIDANVYVRHERGGLMLGGYEPDPLQPDVLPDDVATLPLNIEVLWRLARNVSEQFPIFQDPTIRVAEHRGGLPTLTMDDRYLVGPLPGVAGAWVMSGCCVGGLSVSPALGEAIAEWIVDGGADPRPLRDLPRALRRPRPRRSRVARALPPRLRDPLPRGGRGGNHRVNHPSTVFRFGHISGAVGVGVGSLKCPSRG